MEKARSRKPSYESTRLVERYFSEIRRLPRLSREQEFELSARIQEGSSDAVDRLVEGNLSFVAKIAHEYRHLGVPLEDLLSEGNLGLIEAARRFDASRGIKFISYAVWWIRKFILEAVAFQSHMVRVPRSQLYGQRAASSEHTDEEARRPPHREIRIEQQDGSQNGQLLAEIFADAVEKSAEQRLLEGEARRLVREALSFLAEDEQSIIVLRFGLDGRRCHTLQEIGTMFGVSREWIRRVEARALDRMLRILKHRTTPLVSSWRPRRSGRNPREAEEDTLTLQTA